MTEVANSPLVIAQILYNDHGTTKICPGTSENEYSAQIILQEYPYYVRPKGYYIGVVDRENNPNVSQTLYVTKFGAPLQGVQVNVIPTKFFGDAKTLGETIPIGGVIPTSWTATTNENGLATVIFKINEHIKIPIIRHYTTPICTTSYDPDNRTTLPIDGQVYFFYYCVDVEGVNCDDYNYITTYIFAHSDVHYFRPYTR